VNLADLDTALHDAHVMAWADHLTMQVPKFGQTAPVLAGNGYDPIPVVPGTKRPRPRTWQCGGFTDQHLQFADDFTGILTRNCPAVDIDVSDPELVREVERIVLDVVGRPEATPLIRVGNAPRALLPFRTESPFPKQATGEFELTTDPVTNGKRKPSKVEVLADGQQFVAFAFHPDTRRPYSWLDGRDPLKVARDELPLLNQEQAIEIVRRADELLAKHGDQCNRKRIRDSTEVKFPGELKASDPTLLREALAQIPNEDEHFDDFIDICYAVKGALGDDGEPDFLAWSAKSSKHDEEFSIQQFRAAQPHSIGAGTIFWLAGQHGWQRPRPVTVEDFFAYLPAHQYIFIPTRELWPAASVNARAPWPQGADGEPVKSATWVDRHRPVEQMTWAPGEPLLIEHRLVSNGGWIERPGCSTFNLYRPPEVKLGDPQGAATWIDHVNRVYGLYADHIIDWLAHRVQRPGEKINHALVLGGAQGIGKDTILEPVKYAVGPWNFCEVSPGQVLGRFNGFIKSVILRVSEARDLGDVDRYAFYDHMKVYTAAPPDVLRCDEKNLREYAVLNVCGVIITTNHKADGVYLPADDRRHYVAWSDLTKEDFSPEYWQGLYRWYEQGGKEDVAAFLVKRDISTFDPKAPPPKSEAFYAIANANRAPEDAELADLLDSLGRPAAVTLAMLEGAATFADHTHIDQYLKDRKNRRAIPHRLEEVGYVPVRNPDAEDGLWRIDSKRQAVYALRELPERGRLAAAGRLGQVK